MCRSPSPLRDLVPTQRAISVRAFRTAALCAASSRTPERARGRPLRSTAAVCEASLRASETDAARRLAAAIRRSRLAST